MTASVETQEVGLEAAIFLKQRNSALGERRRAVNDRVVPTTETILAA